jgi:hypothetical protein
LTILKEIKSIRIKAHLHIRIMHPLGTKVLTNEKKNSFEPKGLLKIRSNSNPSKIHN